MNLIGLIPAAVFFILGSLYCAAADGEAKDYFVLLFLVVSWYVVSFLCINGKRWNSRKQLCAYFACLFFPLLGWFIICLSKDGGQKCVYCGSTLNPGASVCAKCGRDQTTRRPAARVKSVPCPICGKPIPESSLVAGANTCPHCGQAFECEA